MGHGVNTAIAMTLTFTVGSATNTSGTQATIGVSGAFIPKAFKTTQYVFFTGVSGLSANPVVSITTDGSGDFTGFVVTGQDRKSVV